MQIFLFGDASLSGDILKLLLFLIAAAFFVFLLYAFTRDQRIETSRQESARFDAMMLESELRKVRRSQRTTYGVNTDLQKAAITFTEFEFEALLVNEVWGRKGRKARQERLMQSPYRWEIERLEKMPSTEFQGTGKNVRL